MTREKMRGEVKARAELAAEERVIDALVGSSASKDTRSKFRQMLRSGELSDREIELELKESGGMQLPTMDIPGMPGAQMGMINLNDMLGSAFGNKTKKQKLTVDESYEVLIAEESDNLLDDDKIVRTAIESVEQNGIVFLDEIDKICARAERTGGDVSREGVQRDLLPLIEGTNVSTKHGAVRTDHILFIASGAFHVAKPADLLPELQGRLPIRVELDALTREDMVKILREPETSLIKQYVALIGTEGVQLSFSDEAIEEVATLAAEINSTVENIGARRLQTVLEKILDEISFDASEKSGTEYEISAELVRDKVGALARNADLSQFIL